MSTFCRCVFLTLLFVLTLGVAFGQDVTGLSISPNPATGGASFTGTVTLSKVAGAAGFKVTLASTSPSIALVPASVTVASGKTTATFTGSAGLVNADESAKVNATDPSHNTVSATIEVNPPAVRITGLSLSPASVEASSTSTGTVTLSADAPASGTVIKLASDYPFASVPASVTVKSGAKAATFTVTTTTVSATAVAAITATDPSGYAEKANLTVELPVVRVTGLSVSPTSEVAASSSVGTVTLSANAPSSGLTVKLAASSAYASVPASVSVKSGAKTATFTISTNPVPSNESVTITATDPANYKASDALEVTAPSVRLTGMTLSPTTVTAANPSTATINLSADAPTGGFVIKLSTGQTYISIPSSITVPAGSHSTTFTVTTKPVATAGTAVIDAVDKYGYAAAADLTVNVPSVRLTGLTISPSSVTATSSATGTLTLSANAPTGGWSITLSSNQSFAKVPSSATVAAGSKTATFTITTSSVSSAAQATISGVDKNGYAATGSLTVNPQNTGVTISMVDFSFSPQSVTAAAGTKITFQNTSFMSHTASSDVATQTINSGSVAPNGIYYWTIPANAKSGTAFYYHCQYHGNAGNGTSLGSGMAGVIFVK